MKKICEKFSLSKQHLHCFFFGLIKKMAVIFEKKLESRQ